MDTAGETPVVTQQPEDCPHRADIERNALGLCFKHRESSSGFTIAQASSFVLAQRHLDAAPWNAYEPLVEDFLARTCPYGAPAG